MEDSTSALCRALGPHVDPLGLRSMGSTAVHPGWSDAEEALLEEGMRAWGRDFRQIQKQLLPGKAVPDLIVFYYNVWKTRGSARARAWFLAVEEVRAAAVPLPHFAALVSMRLCQGQRPWRSWQLWQRWCGRCRFSPP